MSKKKTPTPNIPKETLLRLRLDGLWQNPALPTQDNAQIEKDLAAVTRDLAPAVVLPVLAQALPAAPLAAQARLGDLLPAWLAQQRYQPALETLLLKSKLSAEVKATLQQWFATLGGVLPAAEATFYCAFHLGDHWQSAVTIFWYSTPQRNRARGLQFLIDRNPPWGGAVKDIMLWPNKPAAELLEDLRQMWQQRGIPPQDPISAVEAKRMVLTALRANRTHDIRLTREFIDAREQFFAHVLTLPDDPETPAFTVADFTALTRLTHLPEDIMRFERTVGRVVMDENGDKLFMDAALIEEDWEDEDEAEDEEAWVTDEEMAVLDEAALETTDLEPAGPTPALIQANLENAKEIMQFPYLLNATRHLKKLSPAHVAMLEWMMRPAAPTETVADEDPANTPG